MRPHTLSHVVLRTPVSQLSAMKNFYRTFLDAEIVWENESICFLTYDGEHHRIGLLATPETQPKPPSTAGLDHIAFTFASLADLAKAYLKRKASGILPAMCLNHGPTTSMYYEDPDGNGLETQVWNFESKEDIDLFLESPEFKANPIGVDFDPEELVRMIEAGVDERIIKKRVETGPRDLSDYRKD